MTVGRNKRTTSTCVSGKGWGGLDGNEKAHPSLIQGWRWSENEAKNKVIGAGGRGQLWAFPPQ